MADSSQTTQEVDEAMDPAEIAHREDQSAAMAQAGLYVLMAVALLLLVTMLLAAYYRARPLSFPDADTASSQAPLESEPRPRRTDDAAVSKPTEAASGDPAPGGDVVPMTAPLDTPHTARVAVPASTHGDADAPAVERQSR